MRYHLKRCVIVNGLIKCKIKLLNLQYFDAQGFKFILPTNIKCGKQAKTGMKDMEWPKKEDSEHDNKDQKRHLYVM